MNAPRQVRTIRPRKWADAYMNNELISIGTLSGYTSQVGDPAGSKHNVSPDTSDETLGAAVTDCLSHSRFLDTEESRADLYDYETGKRNYVAWVEDLMQFGGYKTRRALFKQMMNCSLEQEDDTITIRPSHHEKLEGWSGQGFTQADNVIVSVTDPPAAIGAALREAFRRCT